MCEETMPFVLVFIPLALSLGYDSLVGTAIPFLGGAAGFAGSVFNPFTVGIAQGIAELPLYSGMEYRMVIWVISTISMITFVMMHGSKVRQNPQASPVYQIDRERKHAFHLDTSEEGSFSRPQKWVLALVLGTIVLLVFGILQFRWYINEIAALFLGLGIVGGLAGRLSLNALAEAIQWLHSSCAQ